MYLCGDLCLLIVRWQNTSSTAILKFFEQHSNLTVMTTSTSTGSERSPTDNNNPGPRHEHKRLYHIGATLLAKAFENVPHERLLVLARYGVWVCSSGSRVSCLVEHNARLSTERGPFLLTPYTHCPKEQLVLDLILFLAYIYNLCAVNQTGRCILTQPTLEIRVPTKRKQHTAPIHLWEGAGGKYLESAS